MVIRHPPSVVILPVLDDGRVVLIRQFRHAVHCSIYEIPAGTREPNEPALACAKRELMEETGYSAGRWRWICEFYPAPGISTERMDLFVATALKKLRKRIPMDKDEQITLHPAPARRALQMVRRNKIIDAKTIIGIVWGLNRINWK
jgi:ADP-ribose pyrophosphatase